MKVLSVNSLLVTAGLLVITAPPALAQTFTLTATLTGAGESTQTTNGINTGAFGDATVVGDLGAQTVTYSVRVFNLPSGLTASHIPVAADKTAGPVGVNIAPPVPASNDPGFV